MGEEALHVSRAQGEVRSPGPEDAGGGAPMLAGPKVSPVYGEEEGDDGAGAAVG